MNSYYNIGIFGDYLTGTQVPKFTEESIYSNYPLPGYDL